MKECSLCGHPTRFELEKKLRLEELSVEEVAVIVGCTNEEIDFHMDFHYKPKFLAKVAEKSFVDEDAQSQYSTN